MTDEGWRIVPFDPALLAWAKAALPVAEAALVSDDQPLRCGGTWSVGLDLLPNTPAGAVGGAHLPWRVIGLAPVSLHPAQISTVFPGYPRPSPDETPQAFRFRRDRDGAHVDGLLPIGAAKRRYLREPHAFILGLPLTESQAAPLVAWRQSHLFMRAALQRAVDQAGLDDVTAVDLTEPYQQARRDVFAQCDRVELPIGPGQAIVLDRHCLHGVAPWRGSETAPRMIAYFRPVFDDAKRWFDATGV